MLVARIVRKVFWRLAHEICYRLPLNTWELSGARLGLRTPVLHANARRAIIFGTYEANERNLIVQTLSSDDIVLELGGGIGVTSLTCCGRLGGSAHVHVVEANPALAPVIAANYRLNRLQPNLLVGTIGRTAHLHVNDRYESTSIFARDGAIKTVETNRVDLQDLIDSIQPTYLICDIEGAEVEAFADVELKSVRKLLIEMHPHIVGMESVSKIIRDLLGRGFMLDSSKIRGNVFFLIKK